MKTAALAVVLAISAMAVPPAVRSEDKATPTASPPVEFDRYTLVILRTDKDWPKDKAAREVLFRQHLGHLQAMARAGKLAVAGPLGDQDDKTARGIGLWRTSLEETRRLSSEDPAVRAGVFKVEAMTWSTEKGALAFPVAERMGKQ
jgi:uncharacterized protein YciI